ncbi:MAG: bifunctional adenosylcobinamide kinase/adenosylcobinamide-phosphate guanylyltransferase, partial [Vallitaleaceae bacterium]|nr:bifunctional adenosylcobinamide kinase/adenosylcobinamide-phosphate guanylyltransferase [Vallitaleaceae bacterium]
MLVLVTGGARSGKSSYAEGLLHAIEGEKLYIA